MGYDCGETAMSSAPAMPAGLQATSGDKGLWDVLNEMGLLEWQGRLNAEGVMTLAAFKIIEEGDLPEDIPRLVRKQIYKRAKDMKDIRESANVNQRLAFSSSDTTMKLTVKIISENRSIEVHAVPNETMGIVKTRFPQSVPRPNKINYNSLPVEDHTLLCDANIIDGATLFLIPTKTGPVTLYVKSQDGAVCSVSLALHETVSALKIAVAKEKNCKPSEVLLSYKETELFTPGAVLYELGVHEGAVFICG
eukprot:TRINITY_DN646_c6_g1_i1.p1 TRINITY_DN646_c6_g1~~TRINITY_DN646_c6_g1_i1.p1  ORF type:complete len:263 (+),score=77.01 TRINITY_DN646_c6_g1_i1:40-789(+)